MNKPLSQAPWRWVRNERYPSSDDWLIAEGLIAADGSAVIGAYEETDGSGIVVVCPPPDAQAIQALPALLAATKALAEYSRRLNDTQHAGLDIAPHEWGELYERTNRVFAAIAQAEGQAP